MRTESRDRWPSCHKALIFYGKSTHLLWKLSIKFSEYLLFFHPNGKKTNIISNNRLFLATLTWDEVVEAADRIDGNNKLWQVMWSRYEISTDNEFRPPNGMLAAMRARDKKKMSALRQLGQRPLDSVLILDSSYTLCHKGFKCKNIDSTLIASKLTYFG